MSGQPAWAAVLLAAAVLVWSPRAAPTLRRLESVRAPRRPSAAVQEGTAGRAGRRLGWAVAAGLGVALLLGGGSGVAAGSVAAVAAHRVLGQRADAGAVALSSARSRDLPGACDLLAVTLSAGLPVGEALSAVGAASTEPLGPDLRRIAALYRLGADPRRAWAEAPPELAALGRILVRAGESGSAVGPALRGLAAETRTAARAAAQTALQRAGVWVLAPLGLCFLPAFLCLGVVPLVLGLAGEVFG
jgi:Flp pilus assembly protein TadB